MPQRGNLFVFFPVLFALRSWPLLCSSQLQGKNSPDTSRLLGGMRLGVGGSLNGYVRLAFVAEDVEQIKAASFFI